MMASDFNPPSSVSGMKVLDRKAFEKSVLIPALQIDAKECGKLRKAFSRLILKQPRIKDVLPDPQSKTKRILLLQLDVKHIKDFTEKEKKSMEDSHAVFINHAFKCTYEHYTADQVLSAIMPSGIEVTTAFETIGHIAHLNLKDHQLEFKDIIGQVILDKNSSIRTVVNKTNTIEETFRFFHMELIGGEDGMFASVKQHDCKFEFDFSKVYWNSRLQTEHKRIIDLLQPGDVVCDVFAGVGPFAVPAAKKGCTVYANDLNPESFNALKHNAKLNKVEKKIVAFNMDGRDFLRKCFKHFSQANEKSLNGAVGEKENEFIIHADHVLMNLPAIAVEFLDVFRQLIESDPSMPNKMNPKGTTIHCYCFTKSEDPFQDSRNKVEEVIGMKMPNCKIHRVRNVAPKKSMMCVSFKLECLLMDKIPSEEACSKRAFNKDMTDNQKRGIKRPAEDQGID